MALYYLYITGIYVEKCYSNYIYRSNQMVRNSSILCIYCGENAYIWQTGCHLQLCASPMLKRPASFQPNLLVHFSKSCHPLIPKFCPLPT